MASKIAGILEMLCDGQWHTLKEIRQKTRLRSSRIQGLVDFLVAYGFITFDKKRKQVIVCDSAKEFLDKSL